MMMIDFSILQDKWNQLFSFSKNESLKEALWNELIQRYGEPHRFYHTLLHVAELFTWMDTYQKEIQKPAVVAFAILYHDIVYDTNRDDNEEKSAELAKDHLQRLKITATIINQVVQFILATKTHEVPDNSENANDLKFFLDFDMAILGSDWKVYQHYSENIQFEYQQYTDDLYKAGRKQALEQMASKPFLFYSPTFKRLLEGKARENIEKEMKGL